MREILVFKEHQNKYNIKKACKSLKLSRSGYYDYWNRKKSNRAIENEALTEMIEDIFQENKGRYGARRIQLVLERQGTKVNHKRVSKLMSAHGLIAKGTRKTYRKARKGNPYDNVIIEPFYRTLKKELVQDVDYDNPEQAWQDIFIYRELYYNTERIHSTLGWLSPVQFEIQNA